MDLLSSSKLCAPDVVVDYALNVGQRTANLDGSRGRVGAEPCCGTKRVICLPQYEPLARAGRVPIAKEEEVAALSAGWSDPQLLTISPYRAHRA
jgi:hypothetical protein